LPSQFLNYTAVRKKRLSQLKERENGYFDLQFLKEMATEHQSACLNLLDQSHAQLRQDLFALSQVGFKRNGFFVEFGATNGRTHSNTWLLESQFGWRGILAEPARIWHDELKSNRACTIDTRCVWKASDEVLKFTETPRLENSSISSLTKPTRKLRGTTYDVTTITLNDLLETHDAPAVIDYMSVDTEGSEFDILGALNFDRWSFRAISVEHNYAPQRDDIKTLLESEGYTQVMKSISRFDDWYVKTP
jgi:FkbM family methyltransferase